MGGKKVFPVCDLALPSQDYNGSSQSCSSPARAEKNEKNKKTEITVQTVNGTEASEPPLSKHTVQTVFGTRCVKKNVEGIFLKYF